MDRVGCLSAGVLMHSALPSFNRAALCRGWKDAVDTSSHTASALDDEVFVRLTQLYLRTGR